MIATIPKNLSFGITKLIYASIKALAKLGQRIRNMPFIKASMPIIRSKVFIHAVYHIARQNLMAQLASTRHLPPLRSYVCVIN